MIITKTMYLSGLWSIINGMCCFQRFDDSLTYAAKFNLHGTKEITDLVKEFRDLFVSTTICCWQNATVIHLGVVSKMVRNILLSAKVTIVLLGDQECHWCIKGTGPESKHFPVALQLNKHFLA